MFGTASFRDRKSSLLLVLALVGGIWWWTQPHPPPEPTDQGRRLSNVVFGAEFRSTADLDRPAMHQRLHGFGPGAVAWLTYYLERGRCTLTRDGPRPFDRTPDWLRRWMPEKWGGLRSSPTLNERANAAFALGILGSEAESAIPALAASLNEEDSGALDDAALALNAIGPASWTAVHEALEHGSVMARKNLLTAMVQRIGDSNESARDTELAPDSELARVAETLMKSCHDLDAGVRGAAAYTIGTCHLRRPDTAVFDASIPELIRLLSDSDHDVLVEVLYTISHFGAKGAPAIPRLIELLDHPSPDIRSRAANALGGVDQSEKRSAARLRLMLHDPDSDCRKSAAWMLEVFGLPLNAEHVGTDVVPTR